MNAALSLQGVGTISIDELLTFVGVSSKNKTAKLSGSANEVAKSVISVIDEMLLLVIEQRTAEDFISVRGRVIPDYLRAVHALSQIIDIVVPDSVMQQIVYESFSELEAELREQGLNRFGAEVRDQAMFTVWTLRKISDIVGTISKAGPISEELKAQDAECVAKFSMHTAWAQFHMNCLVHAIRTEKPIFPEVLSEIQDGLRAMVNAYAWIRRGVDLRMPQTEPVLSAPDWDEEDRELLESSMRDIETDLKCSDGN